MNLAIYIYAEFPEAEALCTVILQALGLYDFTIRFNALYQMHLRCFGLRNQALIFRLPKKLSVVEK
jgi:hypothetical protein